MNTAVKITKARTALILDHPFFGSLALRLEPVEDPTCPTAWTDGIHIGYNPAFIDPLDAATVTGILAHEVMHPALLHHTRRGSRDPRQWNRAADYAINGILIQSGFRLPPGILHDPKYDGMTAEAIYNSLQDDARTDPGQGDGSGTGDGQESTDPGGAGEVRDFPGEPQQGDGSGKPKPGSGAGRPGHPSPSEIAAQEENWKIYGSQAAAAGKAAGNLPGNLAREIEKIVNPRLPWKELLRRFMDQTARTDYAWIPPNRRHIAGGLYLPGIRSQQTGTVIIAVDTSGSITPQQLDQFGAEITAILEETKATAAILYCDTEISGSETVTPEDLPLTLHPAGYGGTDFRPPFKYLEDHPELAPACLIYLTDLDGPFPDYEPPLPVLWISTDPNPRTTPPFGELIIMELDR